MKKRTLIDDVYTKTGFDYLSDLRAGANDELLSAAIVSVNAQSYSLEEWRALAAYITGKNLLLESVAEVRERLLELLSR